jgi:hypothetical protein
MIALVYQYVSEGGENVPGDLQLAWAIKKYGTESVYGRPLGAGEIRRINMAENIYDSYLEREHSENWVTWAREHQEKARLLDWAAKVTRDYGR